MGEGGKMRTKMRTQCGALVANIQFAVGGGVIRGC